MADSQSSKKCTRCGEVKPIGDFSLTGTRTLADGTKKRYLNSWCKTCVAENNREYFRTHPEKRWARRNHDLSRQRAKSYYRNNVKYNNARCRRWRAENKERHRALVKAWKKANRFYVALKKARYDAEQKGYCHCTATVKEIEDAFTGFCHICGKHEGARKLNMDHCHVTGKFRGWVCARCNSLTAIRKVQP